MTNSLTGSRQKTLHTHRRLRSWTKRNGANLVFLAPFTVLFFTFTILPILAAIVLSFTYFNMVAAPTWVGFSNYVRMFFDDNVFLIALRNTAIFAMITGPISYILSFLIAWLINEFPHTLRTVLTLVFYLPSLAGNVYFVWTYIFSGDSYGYINSILLSLGLITEPVIWLKDASYIMPIIIIVQLWQSMGVSFLANISGLQNVNGELYEAGSIDGIRNRWQELWYITFPTMKNILLFSAVMQIQASFAAGTVAVELAGFPSVNHAADTIVSHMMDVGTVRYEMGYASAIAVFLFAIMAITRILIGKLLDLVGK